MYSNELSLKIKTQDEIKCNYNEKKSKTMKTLELGQAATHHRPQMKTNTIKCGRMNNDDVIRGSCTKKEKKSSCCQLFGEKRFGRCPFKNRKLRSFMAIAAAMFTSKAQVNI